MKIRLYKSQMTNALLWYQNKLSEKHMNHFLTPARVELIERDLVSLQSFKQNRETNSVWKVPVRLELIPEKNIFHVVPSDESNLLYLHEEE